MRFLRLEPFHRPNCSMAHFPPEGTIGTIDVEGKPLLAIVKFENDFMYQGYVQSNSGNYLAAIPFFQKAVDYDPRLGRRLKNAWNLFAQCRKDR